MDYYVLFRYVHLASILIIGGALFGELLLAKEDVSNTELKRLAKLDNLYGLGSLLFVAAGLTLWLGIGKPSEYYSQNWIFHIKLGLAILLGLLSLPTTLFLFKHKKLPYPEFRLPKYVRILIKIEVALLFIIPLLAVLMAQGYGYMGK